MKRIFLGWTAQTFPNYVAALRHLGLDVERERSDDCDALLLPGGADLDPALYGQAVCGAREIDRARDDCELALFRRFADAGKPIFGVCRGLQLINVALGGTLRQHIDGHNAPDGSDLRHTVRTDDALLRELYGERFPVNSAHHQCVDRPGSGLRAAAWAEDGTVEAIRHASLPIFAVQWHPERLGAEGERLLAAFFGAEKNDFPA